MDEPGAVECLDRSEHFFNEPLRLKWEPDKRLAVMHEKAGRLGYVNDELTRRIWLDGRGANWLIFLRSRIVDPGSRQTIGAMIYLVRVLETYQSVEEDTLSA